MRSVRKTGVRMRPFHPNIQNTIQKIKKYFVVKQLQLIPESELKIIPEAGHLVIEEGPEQLAEIICFWLKKNDESNKSKSP